MTRPESQPRHPLALLADHLEAKRENRNTRGLTIIHPVALRNALRLHDTSSALLDLDPAALRAEQARINALEAENAALRAQAEADSLQTRAVNWVREVFGTEPADCKAERSHRFLEEALEAGQAAGVTEQEAAQLVQYVYGREKGEIAQEVGGVMLTLAPFAAAFEVDMMAAAEAELARVNTPEIIEKCRRKNASKPRNSPLPGSDALALGGTP